MATMHEVTRQILYQLRAWCPEAFCEALSTLSAVTIDDGRGRLGMTGWLLLDELRDRIGESTDREVWREAAFDILKSHLDRGGYLQGLIDHRVLLPAELTLANAPAPLVIDGVTHDVVLGGRVGRLTLGVLGILNGILGEGHGIGAVYGENAPMERLTGFVRSDPPPRGVQGDDAAKPAPAIVRAPVRSSNVASLGYDAGARVLEVEFRSGDVYRYLEVSPETHAELARADSAGSFIARSIRPKHAVVRVPKETP